MNGVFLANDGILYAGKTILASLIIEKAAKISNVQVMYFYCKNADALRDTFIAVARGVLIQLLRQNKNLLSYLYEKSSSSGESCLETITLAKEILETALKSPDKVFIIIDGIDECSRLEKRAIVSWFKALVEATTETDPGRIRCLFISQDEGEIRKLLKSVSEIQIRLEDNKDDIRHYIDHKAVEIKEKFGLTFTATEDICNMVCNRAGGKKERCP
jgi:hypothetical protein